VGAALGRRLPFIAHIRGHRALHSSQAWLAERLDEVAVWAEPYLVASVDRVYLSDRYRRCAATSAGRQTLGTANGLQRVKLFLDRRDAVHGGVSSAMRRTPGKGGGVAHSMQ
jgi:hypothetical protein